MKKLLVSVLVVLAIAGAIVGLSVLHRSESAARKPQQSNAGSEAGNSAALVSPTPDDAKAGAPFVLVNDCNIERVNGDLFGASPAKTPGSVVELSGWLVDAASHTVPKSAFFRFEQASSKHVWKARFQTGGARPDVVQSQGGNVAYARAGFDAHIRMTALPAGTYHVVIQYSGPSGRKHLCDNGRRIVKAS